jgi:hypothetical protein
MGNSGAMENAGKKYGFYLMKIPSDNYKSGYYYAVRYKDPESKKWFPTKKSTDTDDETLAKSFAIENKEAIIQEYKQRKEKRKVEKGDKILYQMLEDYYIKDSLYLQNDKINNIRDTSVSTRRDGKNVLTNYVIPFLKEKNIRGIKELEQKELYADLKIYLQNYENGRLTKKTINYYLGYYNRVLKNLLRNKSFAIP